MSLNATAITELAAATNGPGAGGFNMLIEAQVGDVLGYTMTTVAGATGEYIGFDVYTMISAARVNPLGAGLSASLASVQGFSAWYATNVASEVTIAGTAYYTVQAGDIDANGRVLLTPFYAKTNTTPRVIFTASSLGLTLDVFNFGPVDPE